MAQHRIKITQIRIWDLKHSDFMELEKKKGIQISAPRWIHAPLNEPKKKRFCYANLTQGAISTIFLINFQFFAYIAYLYEIPSNNDMDKILSKSTIEIPNNLIKTFS